MIVINPSLKPVDTILIDDEWIREKNITMDIIMPNKGMEQLEEDHIKRDELKGWSDTGLDELVGKKLNHEDFMFK
jgi:hypothetical protein